MEYNILSHFYSFLNQLESIFQLLLLLKLLWPNFPNSAQIQVLISPLHSNDYTSPLAETPSSCGFCSTASLLGFLHAAPAVLALSPCVHFPANANPLNIGSVPDPKLLALSMGNRIHFRGFHCLPTLPSLTPTPSLNVIKVFPAIGWHTQIHVQ